MAFLTSSIRGRPDDTSLNSTLYMSVSENLLSELPNLNLYHFISDYNIDFGMLNLIVLYCVAISVSVFVVVVLLGVIIIRQYKSKRIQSKSEALTNGDLFSIWNYDGTIAYEDLIKATNNFDIQNCIGTGGYGSVYAAALPGGKVVALKKLHQMELEEPAFEKSFKNEARVLSNIRHKNIIKLYGFCLHDRCMFLVYEYMERGSLFCVLRDEIGAVHLSWERRVNIVKSIAHALSYMHHDCIPSIIHRDISSNNILLNSKLEGFVGDFGAARLLHRDSSNYYTAAAGTLGYMAPGKQSVSISQHNLLFKGFFKLIFLCRTCLHNGCN